MTMTIKKKLRKHKIIRTLKELAEGFVFGVVFATVMIMMFLIYCRMAGPLW